ETTCGTLLAPSLGFFGRECQLLAARLAARKALTLLHRGTDRGLVLAGIRFIKAGDPITGPIRGRLLRMLARWTGGPLVAGAAELDCLFRVAELSLAPEGLHRDLRPDLTRPSDVN